jgi:hypothetical protein
LIRLLFGLALMPSAALTLALGIKSLAVLAANAPAAAPFACGFAISSAAWLMLRYAVVSEAGPAAWAEAVSTRAYVLGHEVTHALAAWAMGGKVHGIHVGESGGHVDLSHSNAFIALAPYCFPIYSLLVVVGYRLLLWIAPGAGHSGQELFLLLMGATLSFHLLKTFESLWDRKQPDLAAAGGAVFSLAWIALANGLVILVLAKALFPRSLPLGSELRLIVALTRRFWTGIWDWLTPIREGFVTQLRRS